MQNENCDIRVIENKKLFILDTPNTCYAFQVNKAEFLTHLHWGGKVFSAEDLPAPEEITCYRHFSPEKQMMMNQEYIPSSSWYYYEPCLKISSPELLKNLRLKYESYDLLKETDGKHIIINMQSEYYPVKAMLHYRLYNDSDIIDRYALIQNMGKENVTIENIQSAAWYVPRGKDYRLTHFSGRWGKEYTIEHVNLTQSKVVLETRTGMSGHFSAPFFALDYRAEATEDSGRVWFGTLQWSGSWKIVIEVDPYEQTKVSGGINDFDFAWPLKPGESFITPVFSGAYTEKGFGEASRLLHRFQMAHIYPENMRNKVMPVIYNSYSALGVGDKLTEDNVYSLAKYASAAGLELFIIDDGWQQALGDWYPDKKKFPAGLKPLIQKINKLGMDFGIWIEPETVERKSELYKTHPEWLLNIEENLKERSSKRVLLNFARNDVLEYIYAAMHKLLTENNIKYLKLDMNTYFNCPYWEAVSPEERKTVWVKYVWNVYTLFSRLQKDFPDVFFENCASGSGRSDLAMNKLFARMNRSDNQDTLDILKLHEGFTWLHPARMAGGGCHISKNVIIFVNRRLPPMRFQAFAGMLGSLAVGLDLTACNETELKELKGYIDLYKKIRHIVHFGEIYRLASHYRENYAVFEYVSLDKKESALFVLGHSMQFAQKLPYIRLKGLLPEKIYTIEAYGNDGIRYGGYSSDVDEYRDSSGSGLMGIGLRVDLRGDFDCRIFYLRAK